MLHLIDFKHPLKVLLYLYFMKQCLTFMFIFKLASENIPFYFNKLHFSSPNLIFIPFTLEESLSVPNYLNLSKGQFVFLMTLLYFEILHMSEHITIFLLRNVYQKQSILQLFCKCLCL